jgi:hypothetical protein
VQACTTELAGLIRPFVGQMLNRQRDPASKHGALLPITSAIDLYTLGVGRMRADVRDVSDDGVTIQWDGRAELIRWDDLLRVTVSSLDADGNRTGSIVLEHVAAQKAAA